MSSKSGCVCVCVCVCVCMRYDYIIVHKLLSSVLHNWQKLLLIEQYFTKGNHIKYKINRILLIINNSLSVSLRK